MTSEMQAMDPAKRFYQNSFEQLVEEGIANNYADGHAIRQGRHRYSNAFAHVSANSGKSLMEMGYGGNGIIEIFAPFASEYHIIDIVDRTSGQKQPGNVTVHEANLDNRFPFEDASFDVILAMMVIEHMYDPFHAFSEVARVAKSGANIFINLPNIGSIRCRLQLLSGRMPVTSGNDWFEKRSWDGSHLHYFTVCDVKRLAALYGLEMIEVRPVGRFMALKRLWPELFCHEITYHFRMSADS